MRVGDDVTIAVDLGTGAGRPTLRIPGRVVDIYNVGEGGRISVRTALMYPPHRDLVFRAVDFFGNNEVMAVDFVQAVE